MRPSVWLYTALCSPDPDLSLFKLKFGILVTTVLPNGDFGFVMLFSSKTDRQTEDRRTYRQDPAVMRPIKTVA